MSTINSYAKKDDLLNARENLIKKNYISPQDNQLYQKSLNNTPLLNPNYVSKTQKIVQKDNKIFQNGNFQGNSQYIHEYIKRQALRAQAVKKNGQLQVGGKFHGSSSYNQNYYDKSQSPKRQKVTYPDHKILPQGKFDGGSTYNVNYIQNPIQRSSKIKHQGQLKIGGQFYGQSSYANNYYDKGLNSKAQKFVPPQNKIMPQGAFQQQTTYTGNYVQNPIERNKQIKPEGQLKVGGGYFEANSSYAADYDLKGAQPRRDKIIFKDNKIMPEGQFYGESAYQQNYSNMIPSPTKQIKHEGQLKVGEGKFQGLSSYANNYYDKGLNLKAQKFVPPQNKIMPEGAFQQQTTYNGNYIQNPIQRNMQFKPQGQLRVGGKWQGQSNYAQNYYDKGSRVKTQKIVPASNRFMPQGAFQQQTTYNGNYIQNPITRNPQFRPEGQLKVGNGQFDGSTSYGQNYYDKGFNGRAQLYIPPSNKFMPQGQFQQQTTYTGNYIENPIERNKQIRPEGQLKVGQGQFNGVSHYNAEFAKKQGLRAQKILHPQNEVMPRGRFDGNTEYVQSYIPSTLQKLSQIRPEANLSIGGKFEGSSTYNAHFDKGQIYI